MTDGSIRQQSRTAFATFCPEIHIIVFFNHFTPVTSLKGILINGIFRTRYGLGLGPYIPSVAYQVILEPGIGQFREFEPRRVHARIYSLGLFLVHKLTCGKRESVS